MVTLRNYTSNDRPALVQLANNQSVSKYLIYTFPFPYTDADGLWWIEIGSKANGCVTKVIEYQNEFAGNIGIIPKDGWKRHIAEIGYWVGQPFWGKGIATQALKLMTDFAFDELPLKKLTAAVLDPNHASKRVLEKCGYDLEGVFKMDVQKNKRFYDIYQYARLNP